MSVPHIFAAGTGAPTSDLDANFAACLVLADPNTLADQLNFAPSVVLSSASTVNIGAAASNNITISGAVTITAFDTIAEGALRYVTFTGAPLMTYNVTSMQLIGGASRTVAAGDTSLFRSLGAGNWKEELVSGYTTTATTANALADTAAPQIPTITATVGSNAMTVGMTAQYLDFRSATLTSGVIGTILAAPANLVISSGSTLGTVNATKSRLVIAVMNNAGTAELAVCNIKGGNVINETGVISTTAEGGAGAADSATTWYSTTARSNLPYRIVGYIESTQATAGTWATAPSTIQGYSVTPGNSLGYGQTWQDLTGSRTSGTTYYNTTGKPIFISVNTNVFSPTIVTMTININGINIVTTQIGYTANGVGGQGNASSIIPAGASYSCSVSGASIASWYELI